MPSFCACTPADSLLCGPAPFFFLCEWPPASFYPLSWAQVTMVILCGKVSLQWSGLTGECCRMTLISVREYWDMREESMGSHVYSQKTFSESVLCMFHQPSWVVTKYLPFVERWPSPPLTARACHLPSSFLWLEPYSFGWLWAVLPIDGYWQP